MATCRYTLVRSKIMGPEAHFDQLQQLLSAPPDYWKAQTPLPIRPMERFSIAPDRSGFSEFQLCENVTTGQVETLLVLMAARMPQLSLELRVEGGAGDLAGLRLWYGKLEAGHRGASGEVEWRKLPHHSTLIGSK